MELNLRKARKLEASIQQYLEDKDVVVHATVRTMGTVEDATKVIQESKAEALKVLGEREALHKARYEIRRLIECENECTGINRMINEKVLIDKLSKEVSTYNSSTVTSLSAEELGDQLKAYSALLSAGSVDNSTDHLGRRAKLTLKTSFTAPVFSKEDVEAFENKKVSYKKTLEDLEDSINGKNLTTKVVLSEDTTKLLKAHKLL